MSTVFISHASEDADLAEDLYHALERAGYMAYLDKKALAVGEEYNVAIRDLVAKSDFFVFLISPESIRHGAYALTELQYAETKWLRQPEGIVPVMVRAVETKALPAFLRQITYFSPKGNATAEVISELNRRSQTGVWDSGHGRADRSARADAYFRDQLDGQSSWYSQASSRTLSQYWRLQTLTVTCALAIPVVLFVPIEVAPLVASVLAVLVVVFVVLGILGNYQVKSFRYRLATERMKREYRRYVNFTAPYTAGLGESRAYELFVENIEQTIQDEQVG